MNEIIILKETLNVIADASKWTQGFYARDEMGRPVQPLEPDARSFCLSAAPTVAVVRLGMQLADRSPARRALLETIRSRAPESLYIATYNDAKDRTYEEIRSVIEETIARLEKVSNPVKCTSAKRRKK